MRLVAKKRLPGFQLDVDVEVGSRVLVVGPNGSGKSTLLKCIAGLWRCGGSRGGGWLYVPPEPQAPKRMKVGDYIKLLQDLLRVEVKTELMGVDYLDKKTGELSSGMAKRVMLAAAFSTDTPLALDEPTAYLDAKWRTRLVELLKTRREAVVATHDVEVVNALVGWDVVELEEGRTAKVVHAHR